jgi:hypothetical protein
MFILPSVFRRTTSGQIGILSQQALVPSRSRFWHLQGDQSQALLESHIKGAIAGRAAH